ncbi:hypothetical protein IG631_06684 [Alternaria alternata]|nr:hypothetical protein IG631_06684 [Alternaria alternata]
MASLFPRLLRLRSAASSTNSYNSSAAHAQSHINGTASRYLPSRIVKSLVSSGRSRVSFGTYGRTENCRVSCATPQATI